MQPADGRRFLTQNLRPAAGKARAEAATLLAQALTYGQAAVTPDETMREIDAQKLRPVYLVVGQERHLAEQVVRRLREEVARAGVAGLNDDTLTAGADSVEAVLGAAKTLPMLAKRRFLLVRDVDKWDGEKAEAKAASKKVPREPPLDRLASYAEDPNPSTVLVLWAAKLDKRRRLYTSAKKAGFLVTAEPLDRRELPEFIQRQAEVRGARIARGDAQLLLDLCGSDLAALADAIERLSLYVGAGGSIDSQARSDLVVRIRTDSVWELVGAVGRRDAGRALAVLADVYDPADRGLKLVSVLAWATRQLLRFDGARKQGLDSNEAAKAAGAPPFKARDLEEQLRHLSSDTLSRWILVLGAADLDLKGGTRRPAESVLERMVLDLCLPG
jgi:DNA polymerase-3 subunit delta